MPGVFRTVTLFLAANPDLGLICISCPCGIDKEIPVGIKAEFPGLIMLWAVYIL